MKNKSMTVWLLSVIVALTAFSSCEKGGNEALPSDAITIMKLKKPEYKDYIIATLVNGADSITAYRANRTGLIGKSGYTPYWELPENWLLVDWKWLSFPFHPLADNVLLENETWDKLTYLQKWPLETPHISQPIVSVYYIKASYLAEFLGKTYEAELIEHVIDRPSGATDADKKEEIVQTMDDTWTIFQTDLSSVIEQGDLEKLLDVK